MKTRKASSPSGIAPELLQGKLLALTKDVWAEGRV